MGKHRLFIRASAMIKRLTDGGTRVRAAPSAARETTRHWPMRQELLPTDTEAAGIALVRHG